MNLEVFPVLARDLLVDHHHNMAVVEHDVAWSEITMGEVKLVGNVCFSLL